MQKVATYIISLAVIGYLGYQAYILQAEHLELRQEFSEVSSQKQAIEADNLELQAELNYLSEPRNLEKELRARFNYRLPNEKLIIVVPNNGEETTSTEE